MTTTPPDTPPQESQQESRPRDSGPRVSWEDIRDLGRIRREVSERRFGGVAGGLARHLDIDPLIVRVAFVVLTFFGGVGLLVYVACWLLVPEDGSDWGRVALDRRSRGVALALVGLVAIVILFSHGWWGTGLPWTLIVVGVLAALLVSRLPSRRTGRDQEGAGGPADPAPMTATYEYVPAPRPVNPRKRGPILFWFTLALMAVALGVLAIVDLAGGHVASSAYPALVLAISGLALLVGSFFGRAGGLIMVGLIALVATVGATVADRWDVQRTVETPLTASAVQSSYRIHVGELVVDLTQVADPASLDGRVVHVDGHVGHLDIRVPPDVNVVAHLDIDGPGGISAFGDDEGGIDHRLDTRYRAGPGAPTVTIDATLDVGAIDLHTEEAR